MDAPEHYQLANTDSIFFADRAHRTRPGLVIVLATAYWTVEVEAAGAA